MVTTVHDRELNLVRDECTEPVVRENLELQERLVAHEQTKADLEDRLTATRSEVSFFPPPPPPPPLPAHPSVRTCSSSCIQSGTCPWSGLPCIIVERPC